MALTHRGHTERALARFDEPPGPTAAGLAMHWHVRGSLLERVGRTRDALAAYARALELDPELAPSAVNRGLLLAREGDAEGALKLLSGVVLRHPRAVGALRNRALVRAALEDEDGFARDLERAYAIDPRPELAAALAAHCAGRGDDEGARAWDAAARRLDPER
jgi:tetratricopeptide (TPR) repeat protein